MKRLYLLLALGISINSEFIRFSDGWLAGDCLDEYEFSNKYGYLNKHCYNDCLWDYKSAQIFEEQDDYEDYDYYDYEYYYDYYYYYYDYYNEYGLYDICYYDNQGYYIYDSDFREGCYYVAKYCSDQECFQDIKDCYGKEYDKLVACMTESVCRDDEECYDELYNELKYQYSINFEKYPSHYYQYYPSHGVVLYGKKDINSEYPIYCDHNHMYTFFYDTVTISSASDQQSDLKVTGYTMVGIPNSCSYNSQLSIQFEVQPEIEYFSSKDVFAFNCGYYVVYEWSGDQQLFFIIHSQESIFISLGIASLLLLFFQL